MTDFPEYLFVILYVCPDMLIISSTIPYYYNFDIANFSELNDPQHPRHLSCFYKMFNKILNECHALNINIVKNRSVVAVQFIEIDTHYRAIYTRELRRGLHRTRLM